MQSSLDRLGGTHDSVLHITLEWSATGEWWCELDRDREGRMEEEEDRDEPKEEEGRLRGGWVGFEMMGDAIWSNTDILNELNTCFAS